MMRVVKSNIIDPTQFDPTSPYYDPKSTMDNPRWQTAIVEFTEAFSQIISLETLKQKFTSEDLLLVRRGNRLSVMPVEESVANKLFKLIL